MFTTGFARDLAERTIATFAQALAALLIADGTGLLNANWVDTLSVAGMAALLSVLKGVGAYGLENETGASLIGDPPPRVERGASDVVVILVAVVVVIVVLALVGVL